MYCHSGCDKLRLHVVTHIYRVFYVQRKRVPNFVLAFWRDLTDGASDSSVWVPASALVKKTPNLNLLTPNVNYSGRTAPLTSKVAFYIFIQQI